MEKIKEERVRREGEGDRESKMDTEPDRET